MGTVVLSVVVMLGAYQVKVTEISDTGGQGCVLVVVSNEAVYTVNEGASGSGDLSIPDAYTQPGDYLEASVWMTNVDPEPIYEISLWKDGELMVLPCVDSYRYQEIRYVIPDANGGEPPTSCGAFGCSAIALLFLLKRRR